MRTVSPGPVKNSAIGTVRLPFALARTISASMPIRAQARSAAGEALARFPPTVATVRVATLPERDAAWASVGAFCATRSLAAILAVLAAAPKISLPFSSLIPSRPRLPI